MKANNITCLYCRFSPKKPNYVLTKLVGVAQDPKHARTLYFQPYNPVPLFSSVCFQIFSLPQKATTYAHLQ